MRERVLAPRHGTGGVGDTQLSGRAFETQPQYVRSFGASSHGCASTRVCARTLIMTYATVLSPGDYFAPAPTLPFQKL